MGIFIPMLCALPDSILGKQRLKAVKTCFCSLKHAKRCGEATYTGPKGETGLARGSIRASGVAIGAYGVEGHCCNFSDENKRLCTRSHGGSSECPLCYRKETGENVRR